MPRKPFKLAPDAAARRVECEHYRFNQGTPSCKALNHPYCLAVGGSPLACSFRKPPEAEDDGEETT